MLTRSQNSAKNRSVAFVMQLFQNPGTSEQSLIEWKFCFGKPRKSAGQMGHYGELLIEVTDHE